ncbi:MAG: hypothetical protein UX27_C0011G0014 [Candidatus Azambacteria bacterium GW2011_GWA2_45_90]|uniref:Uncharacterized protein n=1 Tax=Candidatus Azambacteria bacterium GW2011_GWA2_45_90 TaxID=1618614 RepID=A0A0G1QMU9_9BACT|nr:MAG: hypothetical protein UX27_C0011G0014 [Candidatus Azambacteria bacterium GW2011_GWA2_45_90]
MGAVFFAVKNDLILVGLAAPVLVFSFVLIRPPQFVNRSVFVVIHDMSRG